MNVSTTFGNCRHGNALTVTAPRDSVLHQFVVQFPCGCTWNGRGVMEADLAVKARVPFTRASQRVNFAPAKRADFTARS